MFVDAALGSEPRLVHVLPGRARLHVGRAATRAPHAVERRFRELAGVHRARADAFTGNVLVEFSPESIRIEQLVDVARSLDGEQRRGADAPPQPATNALPDDSVNDDAPAALTSERGGIRRARITVRGLDRAPALGKRVEEALEKTPGVRAVSSPLTGRVLVEVTNREVKLEDLIGTVANLEFPELPGEDRPSHPLDPGPIRQSAIRVATSVAGLAVIAVRQLGGVRVAAPVVAQLAYVTSILNSIPFLRRSLGAIVGRDVSDAAITLPNIAAQTLSGNPLALTLAGAESLPVLLESRRRRSAWRAYERELADTPSATPGSIVRLENGERLPMPGRVVEGSGTATASDGMSHLVGPGAQVESGAELFGGPFVVELTDPGSFERACRQGELGPSVYDRYLQAAGPVSIAYAVGTAITTRSINRTFAAMLLVNPRVAMVGERSATTMAAGRVLRAGVTVVGTRPERQVRRPDTILLDGARLLTDGREIVDVVAIERGWTAEEVRRHAAGVARAAGTSLGGALADVHHRVHATDFHRGHGEMSARVGDVRFVIRPAHPSEPLPVEAPPHRPGVHRLQLLAERDGARRLIGVIVVRPRLAAGVRELAAMCADHGVSLCVLDRTASEHARRVAERAGIEMADGRDCIATIHRCQTGGKRVYFVSDGVHATREFDACDLAIGITDKRHRFSARADLLASDIRGLVAIVDAAVRREEAATDAVVLSTVGNLLGAILGVRGLAVESAGRLVEAVALGAVASAFMRLRGGDRDGAEGAVARLRDPQPERWGARSIPDVLRAAKSRSGGLTTTEAARRQSHALVPREGRAMAEAVVGQLESPITIVMAAGALLSLLVGGGAEVLVIAGTLGINVLLGAFQERKASRVAEELDRHYATTARVLRDGNPVELPSSAVVRGDVLLLAPGDRVPADARVLSAEGLEVDEAALTGESLPVRKAAAGGADEHHVLLDGSDVVAGTGRAVAIAVGRHTRMGATAAALTTSARQPTPLADRLAQILNGALPIALAGGLGVTAIGLLRGQPLVGQLALGLSVALAAVPEGLPLLAGAGEATTARRLARRHAIVRRLASVEALGRVDIACVDKTGTLTEGRLALCALATLTEEAAEAPPSGPLRDVLRAAALASPHPDTWAAARDGTDLAILRAAEQHGLHADVRVARDAEVPFQAARPFQTARVNGRVYVKGAPEVLLPRCRAVRVTGDELTLDEQVRTQLAERARRLAARGLRVLLIAEGDSGSNHLADPHDLSALGFVALADPLRPEVAQAVQRCRSAGVRVIMLTGDHPETACAIARQAMLLDGGGVLTGADIAELDDLALASCLEHTTVVARARPLDKLRIVEALRARGHTVAMTGDGVNDAPALRLADIGVAMGRSGTEVARQAADVILADDDFSTLVEALVEGRGFWRNLRRSVGLLLGGNLGELGLLVGTSALGLGTGLSVRQVLAVNLVTDLLPGLAVVSQSPEHRRLAELQREGVTAFAGPLRADVIRRAVATAVPSLGAALLAGATGSDRRSIAFATVVGTQLAQTLELGRADGTLTPPVASAVALSGAALVAAFALPAGRSILQLAMPSPAGVMLVLGSSLAAPLLNHAAVRFVEATGQHAAGAREHPAMATTARAG